MTRTIFILILALLGYSAACLGQGKVSRPTKANTTASKKKTKSPKTTTPVKKYVVQAPILDQEKIERQFINGYEYVDLALPSGLKWATMNVGANAPEEKGYYFGWGETIQKPLYSMGNSYTYGKDFKSLQEEGILSDSLTLEQRQDAAHFYMGKPWRIPTKNEFIELADHCDWKWVEMPSISGYEITGKNGNSIFLPAAGFVLGSAITKEWEGGHYWTSTPYDETHYAYTFIFSNNSFSISWNNRYFGRVIRPVTEGDTDISGNTN